VTRASVVPSRARPVVVIVGPSAGGKSSVVRQLHGRGVVRVHPTWTTRPPRADEQDGCVQHRFVSETVFERLCGTGFFLETATPFGLPYRYGLPPVRTTRAGPADVVILRAPWAGQFEVLVGRHLVYQIEDTPQRCLERLLLRGGTAEETDARTAQWWWEIELGRAAAARVFVNDGSPAALAGAVAEAIRADGAAKRAGRREVA
jgi:guanylate kinase